MHAKKNECVVNLKNFKPSYKKTLTLFHQPRKPKAVTVKTVELGIPELTDEQFEEISQAAENAARKFIFSIVKQKVVEKLDISVEAEGTMPVNVIVEVDLALSKEIKDVDVNSLVEEAVKEAFKAVEDYLRKLT